MLLVVVHTGQFSCGISVLKWFHEYYTIDAHSPLLKMCDLHTHVSSVENLKSCSFSIRKSYQDFVLNENLAQVLVE